MDKYNKVIVSGFAGSGSSAVVDLLSEVENFFSFGKELRLITDPDGIMDLENALVTRWTPYKSDLSIKRFRKLVYCLGIKNTFPYINQNFKKTLSPEFIKISEEYIQELLSFSYNGVWVGINSPNTRRLKQLYNHFKFSISKHLPEIFISYPEKQFYKATRDYLEKLIEAGANGCSKDSTVIIDEPFGSLNPDAVLSYLYSAKMVIVHRDPRDTFLNALKYKYSFIPKETDKFILWYRFMHLQTNIENMSSNILRVKFEDLILNYDETISKIFTFLNIKTENHISKFDYFNPEVSKANIGLWKNSNAHKDIEKIEHELLECYNF